jgi:putative toxin-antitoxin system antitoxin component (TIGR02293 family)
VVKAAQKREPVVSDKDRIQQAIQQLYGIHLRVTQSQGTMRSSVVKRLMFTSPFDAADLSKYLHISATTFDARIKRKADFGPLEADRLSLVAQVAARGLEVFGDKGKFERWLDRPHMYFEGQKPRQLLDSTTNIGLVLAELDRIQAGVFA